MKFLRNFWLQLRICIVALLGMDAYHHVRLFHEKFGQLNQAWPTHLTKRKLRERAAFMQEELNEFIAAIENNDLSLLADALIDLEYVAKGTGAMMGLPWHELWHDVQRANMAKVRGVTHRGNKVDVKKPPDWVPPHTDTILSEAGYDFTSWIDHGQGGIDDTLCIDDPEHEVTEGT